MLNKLVEKARSIAAQNAAVVIEQQKLAMKFNESKVKAAKELQAANFRSMNLSCGPSAIDLNVLQETKKFFTNYNDTGMGIFEMSHLDQTGEVQKLITNLSFRISKLLNIPQNYQIFFMHGDAHSQFAAIPLNICNNKASIAGYVNTGYSSEKAQNEANKFIKTVDICKTDGKSIPNIDDWRIPNNCEYIHLCANDMSSGIEFLTDPSNSVPICADFSSTLFSRPIDIESYGMIYASSGYNVGPSGVCICIVRQDLIEKSKENQNKMPAILNWNSFANSTPTGTHSIYNTPAIFQLYMIDLIIQKVYGDMFGYDMDLVGKWVRRRANTIYQIIDEYPTFYENNIDADCRSMMNIPFRIYDDKQQRIDSVLEYKFLKEAENESIGGMRVSLYTGIPHHSIKSCAKFMRYFAEHNSASA